MVANHLTASGAIVRQLTTLALPLLIGNILQQLYNMIDAIILGWFNGADAFGAVGIGGTVMNLFLFILAGACTGVSVLLSHLYGKGDLKTFRCEFFQAVLFGGIFTLCVSVIFVLLLDPLLRLIQTPNTLMSLVKCYLQIILGGLLACFLYNLFAAVLRAVGDTFATLIFLGISLFTNLALDIGLVSGMKMGIGGAAWATILSQLLAAACSLAYLCRRYPQLTVRRSDLRFDFALLRRTVQFASATGLQQASIYIGKLLVQGVVNSLGTAAINAYTAATRIEGFANSFGDSGSAAESVFLGQNTGAGNDKRVRQGTETAFRLMTGLGLAMAALLFLGAEPLCKWVLPKTETEGLLQAVSYLRTVAVFYPLCFIGCANVGYFQGTGRINIPAICSTFHLTLRVILSWLLTGTVGLAGVAIATGLGWCMAVSIHQMVKKGILF